jgi:hypothetical protein
MVAKLTRPAYRPTKPFVTGAAAGASNLAKNQHSGNIRPGFDLCALTLPAPLFL